MKKIIVLFLSLFFLSFSYPLNLKGCKKKYINFSAYYSPIYGQKFYYRGSFYLERVLNGKGYRGASGRKVFNGMLAGPKSYKFGTKIYIPGFGVGQIEDRGSAIVEAGKRGEKFDRVDIWVGRGDRALMRALSFGKQVRLARVCPPSKKLKVGFNFNKFPIIKGFFKRTLRSVGLYYGRRDNWVRELQYKLIKLGYLDHKATGFFGHKTKQALISFQKDYGVKKKYLGYFGPETRKIMKNLFKNKKIILAKKIKEKEKKIEKRRLALKKAKETKRKKISLSRKKQLIKKEISILNRGLGKGFNTYEVVILQKYLKKLGYYDGKVTGLYDDSTLTAVAKFQKDYKIIKKGEIYLAGYFGPTTRKTFKEIVLKKLTKI